MTITLATGNFVETVKRKYCDFGIRLIFRVTQKVFILYFCTVCKYCFKMFKGRARSKTTGSILVKIANIIYFRLG